MPRRTASSAAARAKEASGGGGGGGGMEWDLEREMLLMAAGGEHLKQQPSRRPFAADLLQNCDLPPPAKLFGPLPTLQRLENAAVGTTMDRKSGDGDGGGGDRLMRALLLSQSRAREAEEKLAAAGASNGELSALLVRDSVLLSAHRRWVMMLEAENSTLRGGAAGVNRSALKGDGKEEDEGDSARRGIAAWWLALAVCVGIAGVGLAIGKFLL